VRVRGRQQRLVFGDEVQAGLGGTGGIVEQDEPLAGVHAVPDLLEDRHELGVDQDHVVPGVVDGVEDLLGREAHIDGVQHGAHHRHGEEAFEVAVRVPVHHRHRVARLDPQRGQSAGELVHPLCRADPVVGARVLGGSRRTSRRAAQGRRKVGGHE
jgi:hypothetical protein